jgi:hypothetical protein
MQRRRRSRARRAAGADGRPVFDAHGGARARTGPVGTPCTQCSVRRRSVRAPVSCGPSCPSGSRSTRSRNVLAHPRVRFPRARAAPSRAAPGLVEFESLAALVLRRDALVPNAHRLGHARRTRQPRGVSGPPEPRRFRAPPSRCGRGFSRRSTRASPTTACASWRWPRKARRPCRGPCRGPQRSTGGTARAQGSRELERGASRTAVGPPPGSRRRACGDALAVAGDRSPRAGGPLRLNRGRVHRGLPALRLGVAPRVHVRAG